MKFEQFKHCFPRIRGDVPLEFQRRQEALQFSPHTRGCSFKHPNMGSMDTVFPAYAGMFLPGSAGGGRRRGFPRIRGDVPWRWTPKLSVQKFSPHTRGCSSNPAENGIRTTVFPAYAGMFRSFFVVCATFWSFPRIRGDVPEDPYTSSGYWGFSPHTRGCSPVPSWSYGTKKVFPAYAGMFLKPLCDHKHSRCFPRIRGDVPDPEMQDLLRLLFSPHTRGCS